MGSQQGNERPRGPSPTRGEFASFLQIERAEMAGQEVGRSQISELEVPRYELASSIEFETIRSETADCVSVNFESARRGFSKEN